MTSDVVAANVNGDGIMELVFGGRDGRMKAVSGIDGREIWSFFVLGRPVVGDVDSDGLLEVLAMGYDGILPVIGHAHPRNISYHSSGSTFAAASSEITCAGPSSMPGAP